MATNLAFSQEGSNLGFCVKVPETEAIDVGVTDAAIRVFENFLEHIGKFVPPAPTMV